MIDHVANATLRCFHLDGIPQGPLAQPQAGLNGPSLLGCAAYRAQVVDLGQPVGQHVGSHLRVDSQLADDDQRGLALQVVKAGRDEIILAIHQPQLPVVEDGLGLEQVALAGHHGPELRRADDQVSCGQGLQSLVEKGRIDLGIHSDAVCAV